jgi:hypothetical protein
VRCRSSVARLLDRTQLRFREAILGQQFLLETADRVVLPPGLDFLLGAIQVAVALGMAAEPVRLALDQRRAAAAAGARDGGPRCGNHGGQIIAVDRHTWHRVRRCAVGHVRHGHRAGDVHRHPVLVVLADEDDRQLPDRRHVERFVEGTFVRRAVAEEHHADTILFLHGDAHADAYGDRQATGHDAVGAEIAALDIGDVHRAAAPAAVPVFLAEELGEHACGIGALGDAVPVPAVRRKDVIVAAQWQRRTDGAGLLPDRQMHRAVDQAAHVAGLGRLLELADQMHLRKRRTQRRVVERGELWSLEGAHRRSFGSPGRGHGASASACSSRAARMSSSCARRTCTIFRCSLGRQFA